MKYPIIEIFGPTIQGEGALIGTPTYFIRSGGCDSRCKKCDSLHAVIPELVKRNRTLMTAEQIHNRISILDSDPQCGINWITLSGGNPVMHDFEELIDRMRCYKFAVETQGTLWKPWVNKCDLVTVSPKGPGMGETTDIPELWDFMDNIQNGTRQSPRTILKIVVFHENEDDLEFARKITSEFPDIPLYLSVGNPDIPNPSLHGPSEPVVVDKDKLIESYGWLVKQALKDELLCNAIILPQMHVLLWGNKAGV